MPVRRQSIDLKCLMAVCASVCVLAVHAAEMQVKTADGQTFTGEYLGTERGIVTLRTKYGILKIDENDITVQVRAKAGARAILPEAPPPVEEEALRFPEVKPPDVSALVAQKLAGVNLGDPIKQDRQEIIRLIRNFADTNDATRRKSIRTLQEFDIVAYPFITSAYTHPTEIDVRVDLLRAIAVPGRPLTAGVFAEAHAAAMRNLESAAKTATPVPPDYPSKRERDLPILRTDNLRVAASYVLQIEEYASNAGGPYNALLLLEIYKQRYAGEKTDSLLTNAARDRARLAEAAADVTRPVSSWTAEDRTLLAEQLLPLMFHTSDDLRLIAREALKKILPSGHPKWDASETAWVTWWQSKPSMSGKR